MCGYLDSVLQLHEIACCSHLARMWIYSHLLKLVSFLDCIFIYIFFNHRILLYLNHFLIGMMKFLISMEVHMGDTNRSYFFIVLSRAKLLLSKHEFNNILLSCKWVHNWSLTNNSSVPSKATVVKEAANTQNSRVQLQNNLQISGDTPWTKRTICSEGIANIEVTKVTMISKTG